MRQLLTTAAVLLACVAAPSFATVTSELHETHPLARGGEVAIENVNGAISISVWDRDEVSIDATITARDQQALDSIEVEIVASTTRVAVTTNFARSDRRNDRREVEYTVMVPRWARLDTIESVNGSVEVVGVEGGTKASTVNGRLRLEELGGVIEAETVNGSLFIGVGDGSRVGAISAEAVNGSIEIEVPAGAGFDVDVDTVNGRISSDLGLEIEEPRYGPGRSMRGTVGGGGAALNAETVNGSVAIRTR